MGLIVQIAFALGCYNKSCLKITHISVQLLNLPDLVRLKFVCTGSNYSKQLCLAMSVQGQIGLDSRISKLRHQQGECISTLLLSSG